MSRRWMFWLKNRTDKSRRGQQRRCKTRTILEMEILEDRIAPAAPIFVTTGADNGDNDPKKVIPGSFRAAILKADAGQGPQEIYFVIPKLLGTDVVVNNNPQPIITKQVTIDATLFQPLQFIILKPGPKPPLFGSGLVFGPGSNGSELFGLAIDGFPGYGIDIGADEVQIGGVPNSYSVTIINNKGNGIAISGSLNQVNHCFIGTAYNSDAGVGNGKAGILIQGPGKSNSIGLKGPKNVISGNKGNGIEIIQSSSNQILGNYIGTDANSSNALKNGTNGIFINSAPSTQIGGFTKKNNKGIISTPVSVISNNGLFGISITGATTGNTRIMGNFIGTDVTGTKALGNPSGGIALSGVSSITIGSAGALANVISGNGGDGIALTSNSTKVNMVGNFIGTSPDQKANLGNGGFGIYCDKTTSFNKAGGNKGVYNNGKPGYNDVSKKNHIFDPNSIYNNSGGYPTGSGIVDGANGDLTGIPVITSAVGTSDGKGIVVTGYLNSTPDTNFFLEFFGDEQEDPSGYGQGEGYLWTIEVTTDPSGHATFSQTIPAVFGPWITATSTNPSSNGNTSQFAQDILMSNYGTTSGLGGTVWNDLNGNGIFDSGELGIAGLLVHLYPSGGIDSSGYTTYTDANGNYSFTNLPAGSYYLQYTTPSGYSFTAPYQGEDEVDSHADTSTGESETFSLIAGQYDPYYNAGVLPTSSLPTTTTTLSSDENPSAYGDSVDFTATITQSDSVPVGGTVTFMDGNTTLGTSDLTQTSSGYEADFSTSALSVGTHSITAVYNGDGFHTGSTSSAVSQTVQQGYTFTSLVSSANPAEQHQSVTFTATVDAFGASQPTGTVTFMDGSTTLGTSQLTIVNGVDEATYTTATLALGSHDISATYNGDSNYTGSSASETQVISQGVNSTVTLTSSANPALCGQTINLTATVSGSSGTPTGTVTFDDDGWILGTATLNASGQAILSTAGLAEGSQTITAIYGGDATYGDSAAFLTQTANLSATTSSLTSSANPSTSGQSVTFTDTVTPQGNSTTPTGDVTFLDGTTILGTGTLALVNGLDQATFSTSSLADGSHAITAVYDGDDTYSGSDGFVNQIVGQSSGAASTTTVATSAGTVLAGQSVTFTATVTGSGTPTGTVSFMDGETVLGTGTLAVVNGQDQATYTTSTLGFGTHNIVAVYSGDSTFAPSAGSLTQQVNQWSSSTTLVSSANPSPLGQSVTFTATVSGATATPTGTVLFQDGTTVLGTATLALVNGEDVATFSTSALALGTHAINVVYYGDSNYSSSGAWLQQSITQSGASPAISFSPNAPSAAPAASDGSALPQGTAPADSTGSTESPLVALVNQMVLNLLSVEAEWNNTASALMNAAEANWQAYEQFWAFSIQSFFSRQQQAVRAVDALFMAWESMLESGMGRTA